MKKGQGMSLEMIIGLMILLVVAAVIINIFIGQFQSGKFQKAGQAESLQRQKEKAISECQSLCDSYLATYKIEDAMNYCSKHVDPPIDWNDNKMVGASDTETVKTPIGWKACEDRMYCFSLMECGAKLPKERRLNMDKCRKLMCKHYNETLGWNKTESNNALKGTIKSGNCKLPGDQYDWYKQKFNLSTSNKAWCNPYIP